MNFKKTLPILGFLPSEIRFFNGDVSGEGSGYGNGGTEGVGGDPGAGGGGESGGGDIEGPSGSAGGVGPGAMGFGDNVGAPDGLSKAFDPERSAYTPAPESAYLEPLSTDDLTNAFSPAPEVAPAPQTEPEWPSESRFVSTWDNLVKGVEKTLQGMVEGRPKEVEHVKNWVDAIVYGLLTTLGIIQPATAPAVTIVGLGKAVSEKASGKTIGLRIAEATVPEPTFASAWEKHFGFTSPTPNVSPAIQAETEGLNQSLFSVPVSEKEPSSYLSTYYGKGYQSLSTALFGASKESGGLMVFPTSGGATEPEMSSLMKKRESVIDISSLLFLVGMGVVGMVLRKTK